MKEVQVWRASHTGPGRWEELCVDIKQTEKRTGVAQGVSAGRRRPELSWALGMAVGSITVFPPHELASPGNGCCFVTGTLYAACSDSAGRNLYCGNPLSLP